MDELPLFLTVPVASAANLARLILFFFKKMECCIDIVMFLFCVLM